MDEPTEILEPDFEPMPGMIIEYMDDDVRVRSPIRYARLGPNRGWQVGFEGTSIAWADILNVWVWDGGREARLIWERP